MPTRLLDWSGSASTALWFAVNEAVDDDKPAAVWMFPYTDKDLMTATERDTPFDVPQTRLVRPRHVSRRIAAQDGWFTFIAIRPSPSATFLSRRTADTATVCAM
ncbi:hypothetical protein DIE08_27580 [Burkholderia sp. Bp9004]|nr:hypothetical protein DIE08_27580 [Burkholderia sp. Bp9004]